MEVGQDPNWGCSAKEKKIGDMFGARYLLYASFAFTQTRLSWTQNQEPARTRFRNQLTDWRGILYWGFTMKIAAGN
jgi:hypothetical protein